MRGLIAGLALSLMTWTADARAQDRDPTPEEFGAQPAGRTPQTAPPGAAGQAVVGQTYQIAPPDLWLGTPSHSEYVSDYAGTRFHAAGMAVGRLTSNQPPTQAGQPGQSGSCTAWLVARDLILTARHCVRGAPGGPPAGQAQVQFGFDYGAAPKPSYAVSWIEEADDSLDYVVARVAAPGGALPGDIYGVIRVAGDGDVRDREPLLIIHHANGDSQLLIKDGTCRRFSPANALATNLYHRCDTREGSSGAPILSFLAGQLPASGVASETVAVGLHTRGESLNTADDFKIATRLTAIVAASPLLKPLACRWGEGRWRCPSLTRPTSVVRTIPFGLRETYLQQQSTPFGQTYTNAAVQAAFEAISTDLAPAPGLIRARVLGDATVDDIDPSYLSAPPTIIESLRRRAAYRRAEDVGERIERLIPYDRPVVVEVDYRRAEPGGDPRPFQPRVDVFIDVVY